MKIAKSRNREIAQSRNREISVRLVDPLELHDAATIEVHLDGRRELSGTLQSGQLRALHLHRLEPRNHVRGAGADRDVAKQDRIVLFGA